jgi:hypothetical protein
MCCATRASQNGIETAIPRASRSSSTAAPSVTAGSEAFAVALLGALVVAADQRAVGEEVAREVLGADVVVRPRELEQRARQLLCPLHLTARDE